MDKQVDICYNAMLGGGMEKYDVVVLGGGMAGVSAAITSAEMGARTALIERYGYLGGMVTGAYVIALCGIFDGHLGKNRTVRGNFSRITDRAIKEGFAEWTKWNKPIKRSEGREVTIDPEGLKFVLDSVVLDSGAGLALHSYAMGDDAGNIRITGKFGQKELIGKCIIDCTGDADTAEWYNLDYLELSGVTMSLRLGGIDEKKIALAGHEKKLDISEYKYDEGTFQVYGWRSIRNKSETFNDATHLQGICVLTGGHETTAEINGRRLAQKVVGDLRKIPGYENVYVISVGGHIGSRVTRKLYNQYHLSDADENKDFPDSIAIAGNVMVDYGQMKIPYRALLPKGVNNLIYAGRCIATEHHSYENRRVNFMSYELPRLVGPSMATGEAAGIAAALCADRGYGFNDIPVTDIQKEIKKRGGVY